MAYIQLLRLDICSEFVSYQFAVKSPQYYLGARHKE
jgi:hypothetical protein